MKYVQLKYNITGEPKAQKFTPETDRQAIQIRIFEFQLIIAKALSMGNEYF